MATQPATLAALKPSTLRTAFALAAFLLSKAPATHAVSDEARLRAKFIVTHYLPPSDNGNQTPSVASETQQLEEMWAQDKHEMKLKGWVFLQKTRCLPQNPIFNAWAVQPKNLLRLPTELLLLITDQFSLRELNALALVNCHLYSRLNGELYARSKKNNDFAMFWALQHNIVSTLRLALAAGSDPLHPSPGQKCPLQFAVGIGSADVVNYLASKGGQMAETLNENVKEYLVTCLMAVSVYPTRSMSPSVESLLQMGADPNAQYGDRWHMLWYAVRGKHTVVLEDLNVIGVDEKAWEEIWQKQLKTRSSPEIPEIQAQNVEALLEHGADPNAKSSGGISALYLACALCEPGIVQVLLKAGADPNMRDARDQTPLHAAAWNCDEVALIDALFAAPDIELNARDNFGRTPLIFAACTGAVNMTHYFVKKALQTKKVDFNIQDVFGKTPLYYAIERSNLGMVRLLLQRHDIDPNIGIGKQFPLYLAVTKDHLKTVKLLLKNRTINLNKTSHMGMTALLKSVLARNTLMAGALLIAGADPDVVDGRGRTARQEIAKARLRVKLPERAE